MIRPQGGKRPAVAATDELIETNILFYAFTPDRCSETAESLLTKDCSVSAQVLNGLPNVVQPKAENELGTDRQRHRDHPHAVSARAATRC